MTRSTGGDDLLAALDPAQRTAAEALRGPVRILAGAGTGKTRAITYRIAHGVRTGAYTPERILALTFTNRAAAELRARLAALGVVGVQARTFHSAALTQLSEFWPAAVGGRMPDVVDGKSRLIAQAAERRRIRIDGAGIRDIAGEIEWRKVQMRTIDDYLTAGRPAPAGFAPGGVADLMRAYEELKDERRQIDFEDVLLGAVGMLRTEGWALARVQERFRHFVVDEYQDVSPLQQALLELWLGRRNDLCVVGDANQTIFSFTGATSRFLLDFDRRFPDAALVELDRNHRSGTGILDVANRLMRGRPGSLVLAGDPRRTADPPPVVRHASDADEAAVVAASIAASMRNGMRPADAAVLFRTTAQSAAVEAALTAAGIRYRVRGGVPFFEQSEVKQALPLLRAEAIGPGARAVEEPAFVAVQHVLANLGWTPEPPIAPGATRDRWESLQALMELFESLGPEATLASFVAELERRREHADAPTVDAVTLSTLHAAKGLEWDEVHIIGLADGLLPIAYAVDEQGVDEERRLFYVGVTRARRRLALHWSSARDRRRSRFLDELASSPRPTT